MKAGDKLIWTSDKGKEVECEIVAVFIIEDALNKNIVGEKVYRITNDGFDFHVLEKSLKKV